MDDIYMDDPDSDMHIYLPAHLPTARPFRLPPSNSLCCAGHMVPEYQPAAAWSMFDRFINKKPW